MAYFPLRLQPPRPTFPHDGKADEMAATGRHADYWRRQAEAGVTLAVGPVMEGAGAWGMAIVDVQDHAAAEALTGGDPVIAAALGFHYDVLPIPSLILPPSQTGKAV